jgi:hypothetical protein
VERPHFFKAPKPYDTTPTIHYSLLWFCHSHYYKNEKQMDMIKASTSQRKNLYRLFGYCKEAEAMHIKAITNGESSTAAELTQAQARTLTAKLTTHWAVFDVNKKQHRYIMSLMMQMGWAVASDKHKRLVADMQRLSKFLKSKKSPVPKPLQHMDAKETSKLIACLESMLKKSI